MGSGFYPNPYARSRGPDNSARQKELRELMQKVPDCRTTPECAPELATCVHAACLDRVDG